MESRTYTRDLKAKVKYNPHRDWWEWEIRANNGELMAQGQEFTLAMTMQEARRYVSVVRTWSSISRGQLTPSTDGGSWFTFQNTEAQLTRTKGKGKL